MVKRRHTSNKAARSARQKQATAKHDARHPQALYNVISSIFNGSDDNASWGFTKDFAIIDYNTLQKRSNQLYRENPIAHGFIRMLTDNIVYKGLKVKPQPDTTIIQLQQPQLTENQIKEIKDKIKAYFDIWASGKVSLCGQYTFYEMQAQVQETRELFGDCIILVKYEANQLPKLQLIAGNRIAENKNVPDDGIYNGVKINKDTGKPEAYFIKSTTEQNIFGEIKKVPVYDDHKKIQAIFIKSSISKLPHILRGLPVLAVIMDALKNLVDGIKNENLAAKLSSLFVGVHKKNNQIPDDGLMNNPDFEIQNINGDNVLTKQMDKGTFLDLPQGDDFSILQNPKPNPNFTQWADLMINKMFAIGTRVGSQKLEVKFDSSYSSARQVSIEVDDTIQLKADDLNNQLNNVIYQIILDQMIENNLVAIDGYNTQPTTLKDTLYKQAWLKCSWQARLQRHIDPVKHMKEIKMKLELNLITYAEAAEQVAGNDYEHVLKENTQYRQLIHELRETGHLKPDGINQAEPEEPPPK